MSSDLDRLKAEPWPIDKMKRAAKKIGSDCITYDQMIEGIDKCGGYINFINSFPRRGVIYLYLKTPNFGHYMTTFINQEGINIFDSYGREPEAYTFVFNPPEGTEYQDDPNLVRAIYEETDEIIFNEHKQQKESEDIQTCGPSCLSRLIFAELNNDEYNDFINSGKKYGLTPDDMTVLIATL